MKMKVQGTWERSNQCVTLWPLSESISTKQNKSASIRINTKFVDTESATKKGKSFEIGKFGNVPL